MDTGKSMTVLISGFILLIIAVSLFIGTADEVTEKTDAVYSRDNTTSEDWLSSDSVAVGLGNDRVYEDSLHFLNDTNITSGDYSVDYTLGKITLTNDAYDARVYELAYDSVPDTYVADGLSQSLIKLVLYMLQYF